MKEEISEKMLWNDAARVGIVFGLFSSACLGLKELTALSGSTFLVAIVGIVLWGVEFFGCIYLMRHFMIAQVKKYREIQQRDLYKFGRRVALLSGLILAAVNAYAVSIVPPETVEETFTAAAASVPGGMPAEAREQLGMMVDKLPLLTFIGQWVYCFLYGTVLSAIMSRVVSMYSMFTGPEAPEEQDNTEEPDEQ